MARTAGILGRRYGEFLVSLGLCSSDDVGRALAEQEKSHEGIDTILIKSGVVKQDQLLQTVSRYLGIDCIDVAKLTEINADVFNLVPIRLVHQYQMFPLELRDHVLRVVTADPTNYQALDDVRLLLNLEGKAGGNGTTTVYDLEPVLGLSHDIREAIIRLYGVGADTLAELEGDEESVQLGDQKTDIDDLSEDATIIRFVNQIMMQAVDERATDIHFEPFEGELRIRFRIDGLLYETAVPPAIRHYQSAVISRIKIMADMNIAEKRLPQDGRISFRYGGAEYDLRVSNVPTPFGESIVIRILNRGSTILDLQQLGYEGPNLELFHRMIQRTHGIILVTGPTGSGKTTTLYAALSTLNSIDRKIITIEDPIEYHMYGITQIQVQSKIGLTFASVLRSLLRQDPDIMLIGETRDYETAEMAIRAALTGHLVFTTLHTNDAAGAITRLLDMGVEPFLVASSVIGMIAQRLVRTICPHCKEAYHPEHDILLAMGEPRERWDEIVLYRGRGCEACKFLGYRGRTAIYEVIPMTERIRELTVERRSASEIKKVAQANGMITLRAHGWERALRGITTVDEVIRVTQEDVFADA